MSCLDENAVAELVEGRLGEAAALGIAGHLDACAGCRELVTQAVLASARVAARPQTVLAPGTAVGRYVIVELIGVGAMGVVYAAWDPLLSRRVALKLLRGDAEGDGLRERLLGEAQALARLAHPHVIAVHDVGTFGEQCFLAMELVAGETLAGWLAARPRRWEEVLPIFCAAGEGLAAAHAVGLVHRDFKPDNVLVGADGRVRVTDFGLARDSARAGDFEPPLPERPGARASAIAGTPAYMAPEQLRGEPAGARSDQFSFCVALHEALYGERPFAGEDLPALRAAMARGELRSPKKSRVPASARRALLVGLKSEPAERHPSMDALLRELRKRPRVTPIRAAATLVALAAVAVVALRASRPVCTGAEAAWGALWSPAQERAASASFAAASGPSAATAFAQVDRALQSLHLAWTAMRTEACLATRARGEQSEALLDRRMQCLDDRRREAETLAQLFAQATPSVVEHARAAVDALTPLSRCADARALLSPSALPEEPAARAAVEESKALSARAKALIDAGDSAAAIAPAERAVEEARRSGHKPTLALALYQRGDAQRRAAAEGDTGASWLHESAATAEEGHDDGAAADAFILLSFVRGFIHPDPAEGELWSRYAEAAIARMGGDELREALRQERLGALYMNDEARAELAREHLARARELYLRAKAPEGTVAGVESGLAVVELNQGDTSSAIELFRKVAATMQRLNGPDRPDKSVNNLGNALTNAGRASEAVPILQREWAIEQRLQRADYFTAHKLATALHEVGQPGEALRLHLEAMRLYEETHRGDDGWAAEPLLGLGEDLLALRRPAEAVAPLERSLRVVGRGNELAAHVQFALARALWDTGGERGRALSLATEAQAIFRGLDERHGSYYRNYRIEADGWLSAHQGPQAQAELAAHQP